MSKYVFLTFAAALATIGGASIAHAHVIPWRDGDARTRSIGSCAKGPCLKRYDYSVGKPHHHHGERVIAGTTRHTRKCRD